MTYLHSQNVIHQNLKPSNILLDTELNPHISDFFHFQKNENSNGLEITGTSIYTAPEIWNGENYTKKSDVYSFAFIVYEILANEKPFHDLNPYQIISKILQGDRPDFNSSVPPFYADLINRCWSKDPENRPSFGEIVLLLIDYHIQNQTQDKVFHDLLFPEICMNNAENLENNDSESNYSGNILVAPKVTFCTKLV